MHMNVLWFPFWYFIPPIEMQTIHGQRKHRTYPKMIMVRYMGIQQQQLVVVLHFPFSIHPSFHLDSHTHLTSDSRHWLTTCSAAPSLAPSLKPPMYMCLSVCPCVASAVRQSVSQSYLCGRSEQNQSLTVRAREEFLFIVAICLQQIQAPLNINTFCSQCCCWRENYVCRGEGEEGKKRRTRTSCRLSSCQLRKLLLPFLHVTTT